MEKEKYRVVHGYRIPTRQDGVSFYVIHATYSTYGDLVSALIVAKNRLVNSSPGMDMSYWIEENGVHAHE